MKTLVSLRLNLQRLLLGFVCLFSIAAVAQTFPSRPVKLVVTYPPGGSSDLMARIMGQ